ncbi:MarR family winged helix-turn-helix transcriptional regulator [Lysinibacillus sp. SGAir0095]|uniref:MarR family winged helix-turn-helix transcriptional regulator n=1 Tax=Lysinibacillus sp. SGAir0095 TaxID=2070463 RepID=UPI0010CCF227|nr:MarR family transcriptional regulator [Lysinibacillus sp. SGAir0095]QCR30927.1 MarR family transcriptional regulator [Lysinibacillus sp. SGAir0095]
MTNYLENQLCFLLYVTSKEIIRKYTKLLKPYDLTYTGFITMLAIEEEEQLMVKELGSRLFLDSGTLTPLLKKLEEKNYITRERSIQDERQMMVSLTAHGREVRQKLPCISEQISLDMQLTQEQFDQIKGILKSFLKNDFQ